MNGLYLLHKKNPSMQYCVQRHFQVLDGNIGFLRKFISLRRGKNNMAEKIVKLENDEEVKKFWAENKIYEKLLARKGGKFFILDGPPYANGIPHIGHVKNTVFKDMVVR